MEQALIHCFMEHFMHLHYTGIQSKNYNKLFNFLFFRVARWMEVLPKEILQFENSFVFKKKLGKFGVLQLIKRQVGQ